MKVFGEQHEMFRATVRAFLEKEIAPHVEEWEAAGGLPRSWKPGQRLTWPVVIADRS